MQCLFVVVSQWKLLTSSSTEPQVRLSDPCRIAYYGDKDQTDEPGTLLTC